MRADVLNLVTFRIGIIRRCWRHSTLPVRTDSDTVGSWDCNQHLQFYLCQQITLPNMILDKDESTTIVLAYISIFRCLFFGCVLLLLLLFLFF